MRNSAEPPPPPALVSKVNKRTIMVLYCSSYTYIYSYQLSAWSMLTVNNLKTFVLVQLKSAKKRVVHNHGFSDSCTNKDLEVIQIENSI